MTSKMVVSSQSPTAVFQSKIQSKARFDLMGKYRGASSRLAEAKRLRLGRVEQGLNVCQGGFQLTDLFHEVASHLMPPHLRNTHCIGAHNTLVNPIRIWLDP